METIKDLVCGMELDKQKSIATFSFNGKRYHFCSKKCRDNFSDYPSSYIQSWLGMYREGDVYEQ